jgi:hypothetical protein
MANNELQDVRDFIMDRMKALLEHESKQKKNSRDYGYIGFDSSKFFSFTQNDKTYYLVSGRVFNEILNNVLCEATEKCPHLFGTGNAKDVIKAIYQTEPFGKEEDFESFLKVETFGLLIEVSDGKVNPKILQLNLFRDIEPNLKGGYDFTGGIFHMNKHFSYKGIPLSVDRMQTELVHPSVIIPLIAKSFFEGNFKSTARNDTYEVTLPIDNIYEVVFHFYHETNSDVYFLNSARKQSIKKKDESHIDKATIKDFNSHIQRPDSDKHIG